MIRHVNIYCVSTFFVYRIIQIYYDISDISYIHIYTSIVVVVFLMKQSSHHLNIAIESPENQRSLIYVGMGQNPGT